MINVAFSSIFLYTTLPLHRSPLNAHVLSVLYWEVVQKVKKKKKKKELNAKTCKSPKPILYSQWEIKMLKLIHFAISWKIFLPLIAAKHFKKVGRGATKRKVISTNQKQMKDYTIYCTTLTFYCT